MSTIAGRGFRMARRYRRVAVEFLFWWSAVVAFLAATGEHPGPSRIAWCGASIIGAVVLLASALRRRICVDGDGLLRVTLLGRDRWSWSELESGLVRFGSGPFTLRRPGRPWARSLRFGCLEVSERELLYEFLRRRWSILPASEVPGRCSFRALFRAGVVPTGGAGRPRCESLRIDLGPEGISVGSGVRLASWRRRDRSYSWSDVEGLELHRLAHGRHDFTGLKITLPDRAIIFHSDNIGWFGAGLPAREAIVGLLRRHVPESRIRWVASYGPPKDEAERAMRAGEYSRLAATLGMGSRRLSLLFLAFTAIFACVLTIVRGAEVALERCLGPWLLMFFPMLMIVRIMGDRSREAAAYWASTPAIDA